jgi:hypothetical protein
MDAASGSHPNWEERRRQRRVVVRGCKEHRPPAGEECQGCADQGEMFPRADAASATCRRNTR